MQGLCFVCANVSVSHFMIPASQGEIIVLGIFRAMAGFIVRLKFDLAIWIKYTPVWYRS